MKALTKSQKEFLYRELVFGKYRFIAKPFYDFCISTILFVEKIFDFFLKKDNCSIDDLTIIIKTFERDYSVNRLITSIKKKYPKAVIIVVNDSKNPIEIDGVTNLIMPYDSGISAGRNAALKIVKTKYFLLLDDDFVFSRRQNLGLLISQMEQHSEIDILGGRYIDLPFFIIHNFQEVPINLNTKPKVPSGTLIGENRVVDKVQNYFIGRTEQVKTVLWNEALKTLEHTEFFTRAKGKLITAYRDDILILHAKTPFDVAYLAKRFRKA